MSERKRVSERKRESPGVFIQCDSVSDCIEALAYEVGRFVSFYLPSIQSLLLFINVSPVRSQHHICLD